MNRTRCPNTRSSDTAMAAPSDERPDGCSGYGGVLISGSHAASGSVCGVAVGRGLADGGERAPEQELALPFQVVIAVSAAVM